MAELKRAMAAAKAIRKEVEAEDQEYEAAEQTT